VLDCNGGAVFQASIVVVNVDTNRRYKTTSNEEGRFTVDLLPPGDDTACAVAHGMSPQVKPQFHVDVGGSAELRFRLRVAGTHEEVTVSGRAPPGRHECVP